MSHATGTNTPATKPVAGRDVLAALLDKLDAADNEHGKAKRQAARCPYRRVEVPVRIHHPGGSSTVKAVATRNLSQSGIGFLYGGFLYNGTQVEVVLKRRADNAQDVLRGVVAHCGHISGVLHMVGVRFEEKLDTALYLDAGVTDQSEAPDDLGALAGRVVYVDAQETDRLLLEHHLKRAPNVKLTLCESVACVQAALPTDLILCEPGETGSVAELRAGGYAGPICLVTAEADPARLAAARAAGASGVLSKPYTSGSLLALLANWLHAPAEQDGAPLHSTLAGDASMRPMLAKYVERVRAVADELEKARAAGDGPKLRVGCVALKGSGAGFGFAPISDAARAAVERLDAPADAGPQVGKLIALCRRAALAA